MRQITCHGTRQFATIKIVGALACDLFERSRQALLVEDARDRRRRAIDEERFGEAWDRLQLGLFVLRVLVLTMPRMIPMARVMMNGGTPSNAMQMPLTAPIAPVTNNINGKPQISASDESPT